MATTTMKAMLMIDLGGNAVRGLKGLFDRLSSGGLITEKNRHHWQGMAKDIAVATASLGLFAKGVDSLKQRLPGARELQTALRELRVEFTEPDTTKIDASIERYTKEAFDIQLKFKTDQTETVKALTYLRSQQWAEGDILGKRGMGSAAAAMMSIFDRDYPDATAAAVDVSAFLKMFGLEGSGSMRYADLMSQAKSMGLSPSEVMHNLAYVGGSAKQAFGAKSQEERWRAAEQSVFGLALGRAGGLNPSRIGTTLQMFMQQSAGVTPQAEALAQKRGLNLWRTTDDGRKVLKDFSDLSGELNRVYGNWKDSKRMAQDFAKLFGVEGGRYAALLLDMGKNTETLNRKFREAPDALKRIEALVGSSAYERDAFQGTMQSISDSTFQTVAEHEGLLFGKINQLLPAVGKLSQSRTAQTATAAITEGALLTMLGLGLGFGARGLSRGVKGLQAAGGMRPALGKLMGLGEVPAQMAVGKLLQKVDKDLQRVFVVNWPATLGGPGVNFKPPKGAGDVPVPPVVGTTAGLGKTVAKIGGGSAAMLPAAATMGVAALGAGAIYATSYYAGEARDAVDVADYQRTKALRFGSGDLYELIAANKARRGKAEGWTPERIAEETRRTFAAMKAPDATQRKVLDEQRQAAKRAEAAAQRIFDTPPIERLNVNIYDVQGKPRVEVYGGGTRQPEVQSRRIGGAD